MKLYSILLICSIFLLEQKVFNAASIGSNAIIRGGSSGAQIQQAGSHMIQVAPSLIASKLGLLRDTPKSNTFATVEIPKSTLAQLQAEFSNASRYADTVVNKPINFQEKLEMKEPIHFDKSKIVGSSPQEAKSFLDLQLVNALKNKNISFSKFSKIMLTLAAMFGFYNLTDFLNNLYENNTILMWAVEAGNENIVEFLVLMGADIHKKNSDGDTAMLLAARWGNEKIIQALINAVQGKYKDDPKKAKEEIAKLINTKNNYGRTAFLDLIEYGNFLKGEEVANPVEYGRIDIIRIFINNGADITVQDNNGDNVLFFLEQKIAQAKKIYSVENDSISILKELFDIFAQKEPSMLQVSNNKGQNLLLLAVMNQSLYLFNYLKDEVIDVMQQDNKGQNIIFKAVQSNNIAMIEAVVNLIEDKWSTSSKKSAHSKIKELLEIKDKQGQTVLDRAIGLKSSLPIKASLPIVKLLVEKGAQLTNPQLSFLVASNNIDVVKLFLSNSKLSPSMNDLSRAFNVQNPELLKVLLDSKYLPSDTKNKFVKHALLRSLHEQKAQMFNLLFTMIDEGTKEKVIKNIVSTDNPEIINNFLDSSEVTDQMRREIIKEAVLQSRAASTIKVLLNNPHTQKAYEDPTLRSLILREAIRKFKKGNVSTMIGRDKNSITKRDLENDPTLKALLSAWEPKFEANWNHWVSDTWSHIKGQKGSKEIFADKQRLFETELNNIIAEENYNRQKIAVLSGIAVQPKKSLTQKIKYIANIYDKFNPKDPSAYEEYQNYNS